MRYERNSPITISCSSCCHVSQFKLCSAGIVIRADTSPFKWKPEKVWTKSIPNGKFGEFCIYETVRCSGEVEGLRDRLDSSNLFIAS